MIVFDVLLLLVVSIILASKILYLGAITLIVGFLIGFQNLRTIRLLGDSSSEVSSLRKVKALALSIIICISLWPLLSETLMVNNKVEKVFSDDSVLPIVIMISLLAALMMSSLSVEKRKR